MSEPLDVYYRARILVVVSFTSVAVLLPFLIERFLSQGMHPYTVTLTCLILAALVSPVIMKLCRSVYTGGLFLTSSATVALTLMCLMDGGVTSPTIFGLCLMPLFGIFFVSTAAGTSIAGALVVIFVFMVLASGTSLILPSPIPDNLLGYYYAGSALSITCILVLLASLFVEWQRIARQALTEANMAKSDFLSGMSHELRTPLNSIMGFSEILAKEYVGSLNDKQKEQVSYVSYINESGQLLLGLVDDLLDITRIESGRLEFEPTNIRLEETLSACIRLVEITAAKNQVAIHSSMCEDDLVLWADPTKFRQIVINLLTNAIKFTPPGGCVQLESKVIDDTLHITVEDSGPGVNTKHKDFIFDKFYQAESSLANKTIGAGLGLYISRTFARLHGGELSLVSTQGTGARFLVTIPQKMSEAQIDS